jgi:hypothetical protein
MQTPKSPMFESESERRGKLRTDTAGEFHFEDTADAVSFVAGQVRRSRMKYNALAKAGSMSGSTVSNMATGKTHYPRFSTMAGLLGAMGLEVIFKGRTRQ